MHEREKLEAYYAEGRALWEKDPGLVVSRRFFELWQECREPAPFLVDGDGLVVAGHAFELPEGEERIAEVWWHFSEETAVLSVETADVRHDYLLGWSDGEPDIRELDQQWYEETEVSFGERLEVVYEVIAWVRRTHPQRDVRELTCKQFRDALAAIAGDHPPTVLRVMRRLRLPDIRRMLRKAAEDMTVDELSDQLELPLGGNYAVAANKAPTAVIPVDPDTAAGTVTVPPRTRRQVQRQLDFIAAADLAVADLEEHFVLVFVDAELLHEVGPTTWVIKVPASPDLELKEGTRLPVFRRGENRPIANFLIDLNEGHSLIGRLFWDDAPDTGLADRLYARARRSPATWEAQAMNAMRDEFRGAGRFASPALNVALGVEESTFRDDLEPTDLPLNKSQRRAWSNAVNPDNPVVLIQGPPGTGKTHVLEQVLRELCLSGCRILVAAPSNTAVDNVCRRVLDLPVLRLGNDRRAIAPEIAEVCWIDQIDNVRAMQAKRRAGECIFAGTHVGVMRDDVIRADIEKNGLFDAVVFDEAGMARLDEFFLCASLAKRAVLFGDHQQLPPFPLPVPVVAQMKAAGPIPRRQWAGLTQSALEWLATERQLPVFLLQSSYRCQNPRLMRFSSTLFYDARVRPSIEADYYSLGWEDRRRRYPAETLRFYRTSGLPLDRRAENLTFHGNRPGLENRTEAQLAVNIFYELLSRYPLAEISVITPYRRQARLLREVLDPARVRNLRPGDHLTEEDWEEFLHSRVATVDSFQGGESDAVLITYVRSNSGDGVGFVDDPNRVNVAHTRCRREMVIIGDLECLKQSARSRIFARMERAIARDGRIIDVTPTMLDQLEAID